ncbi:MAG TPA: prenyltransferase [Actinomycetota bacterium]|nr:prenyltransferase [Actinomycetota bacterium]
MAVDSALLREIEEGFDHAVVVFVGADGYPVGVATDYRVDAERGVVSLVPPAGEGVAPPEDAEVNVIVSHIRPQETGYDERRYVQLWGRVRRTDRGLELAPERSHTWDEKKVPFFQYSELTVPQAHRYLRELGRERGTEVRPKLSFGWLALRTTRAPFLTATVVPILLGVAAAALDGRWSLFLAGLTLLAGSFVHLGLNIANDVFDTTSGADAANTTPTQFSGGSRVVHYGLVRLRTLALLSASFYLAGIGLGLYLAVRTDFWPLFWLGAAGVVISVFYTAPPLRLVHRGLGEIAVAIGFGPIMLLGAFFVQAQRFTFEAVYLSIPVAILIALVLYVNEIPDRAGDAAAGKRTLPVRWSKDTVIGVYAWSVGLTYALIAVGAVTGILPRPTLIALATIPIALRVTRALRRDYDDPYALMFSAMGSNIKLHLFTGLLLLAGYLVAIGADRLLDSVPVFLR